MHVILLSLPFPSSAENLGTEWKWKVRGRDPYVMASLKHLHHDVEAGEEQYRRQAHLDNVEKSVLQPPSPFPRSKKLLSRM